MKFLNINKALAYTFCLGLIITLFSCTQDDVWELEDKTVTFSEFGVEFEQKGALVAISDVVNGFYNFAEGENASVGFTVDDFGGEASAINVYKSFNGGSPVLHTTINSFPSDVNISLGEAVSGLVDFNDVKLLDQVVYTFDITTADGTFPSGASLEVNISCTSDLAGEYNSTVTGTSTDGCCPGSVTTESTVTLTDEGGGVYTISDWSANIYFVWYGPGGGNYGIDEAYIAGGGMSTSISDVCNEISAEFTEPFGTATTLSGSVDPSSGVITFTWVNGYADQATVVLTPK